MMAKKTLNKELMEINNKLFAAKAENTLQFIYEKELAAALGLVFQKMKEEVLKNLEEYYSTDVMLKAHMDLILSPIHEYHRLYYETIEKYILREYQKGKSQGKRLVSNAKAYAKNYSKLTGAVKADTKTFHAKAIINKGKLFGTSDFSAEHMTNKTFVASENTLARVDKDINGIITDGYRDGKGINDVGKRIEKRFNQFKTWEANRIARTEIHGSHMQGVLQSYQDMDVQYIQWAAAHDSRVRDTHADLDGEIILMGATFSNGLKYPGDTTGKLSEFINCRCGAIPWFCPPGYAVPNGMTRFRESDLVVTLDKWSNEQLLENITTAQSNTSAVPGMNKYSLTQEEKMELQELLAKQKENKIGLLGRGKIKHLQAKQEFNTLYNKKLTSELTSEESSRYEYLLGEYGQIWGVEVPKIPMDEVFENPQYFNLSPKEQETLDMLNDMRRNKSEMTSNQRQELQKLRTKKRLGSLHEELLNEGLDEWGTKDYIKEYKSLNQKVLSLPDIDVSLKFTPPKQGWEYDDVTVKIGKKFQLTDNEADELYYLKKKQLFIDNKLADENWLTSAEKMRMDELQNQKQFNYLYYLRKGEGGLDYQYETLYKNFHSQLKSKLDLSDDLLKSVLPEYKLTVKPEPITSKTKLTKMKDTTEDGSLPGNREVSDYFTIDLTKCTPREQAVAKRWLGNDYAYFRDVIGRCDGNIDEYVDYVLGLPPDKMSKYYPWEYNLIEEGNTSLATKRIRDLGLDIKHDYPVLENILENNQIKKPMTLWRTEERLHIDGTPEVGKIVTFKGTNSTAVTREGAEHFGEVSHRKFEWIYEIEAPKGTRGAYVAELNGNPKFAQEMEFLLAKDTQMEIIEFDEVNHYVKYRILPNVALKSKLTNVLKKIINTWRR